MRLIKLLFLLISINTLSFSLDKIFLQLNWKYQFEFAGFIVAKEKGYYKDVNLDVDIKEFNHNINVLDEINSGNATYGIYDLSLLNFNKNTSLQLVANYFKRAPLIFIAKQDILTPDDLKNKTIMVEPSQLKSSTLSILLKKFNIKEDDLKIHKHTFNTQDFTEGKIDVMSAYVSNELYFIKKSKKPYIIIDPLSYGIYGSGVNVFTSESETKNNPKRVENFIKATNKGWLYALEHKAEIVDLIYNKYSKLKSKKALLFEANETEKLMMPNIYNIGEVNKVLLQKNINEFKNDGLLNQKVDINNIVFELRENTNSSLVFTEKQKKYIKKKKEITMCIDPDWMPYEKLEKGKHIGMTAELMPFISQKIGIPIKLIPTKNWTETIKYGKNRKCDIFSLAMSTNSRLKYMNFTIPYLSFPLVISTRMDKLFIPNPENLIKTEKIGIVKDYAISEIIKNDYPKNKIVDVPNVEVGMKMVSNGQLFGFVGALPTIAYNLQHEYVGELKIAGKFERSFELGVGVRNDDPILFELFEKAIQAIPESTKQEIISKYISVNFTNGFDYSFLYKVLLGISLIAFFGLYRHRQVIKYNEALKIQQKALSLSNRELKVTEKRLKSSIDDFETLLDSVAESIFVFENEVCIDANKIVLEMFGYDSKEEVIGKEIKDFVYQKDLKLVKDKFLRNMTPYELHGIKKSGEVFDIMAKGINTTLNGKKVRISSVTDITEMKHKEKLLFQQSKMASMGEMIDNIAHQWRQPLSLISTISTGLELKMQLEVLNRENSHEDLQKINNTVQHLSQTIDDFRDFFKSNKNIVEFSVLESVKKNLFLLDAIFNSSNIEIVFEKIEDVRIESYENEFTQALINIFYNAKDAMEKMNTEKYIFINMEIHKNNIVIKIKDNAGGIDDNIIGSVFEPYFTTKHQSQGTGIGLYMTHQIIEKHMKGSIYVQNTTYVHKNIEYTGAEFILKLPI